MALSLLSLCSFGDGGTCAAPISAQCTVNNNNVASASHDPHIRFAEGGVADFRGENGTFYALLSAPGVQFSARTVDTTFMLPIGPILVEGSFFSEVSWVLRGVSGTAYGVSAVADILGFEVFDLGNSLMLPWSTAAARIASRRGIWQEWWQDGVRVYLKQSTIFVRANGWETNVTRNPIYLHVSGPARWRFDVAIRQLDNTGFDKLHGAAGAACMAHGLIGQSFDADGIAVSGKIDTYAPPDKLHPVVKTRAQAEGAIEGNANDYKVSGRFSAVFRFGRFSATPEVACAGRNVSALSGVKAPRRSGGSAGGFAVAVTDK